MPTRLLLYQHADHPAFILKWTPLERVSDKQVVPAAHLARHVRLGHDDPLLEGMTPWGNDFVRVVLGTAETQLPRRSQAQQGSGVVAATLQSNGVHAVLPAASKL